MNKEKIEQGVRLILEGLGEDPDRPGLRKTPHRVAAMFEEILGGIGHTGAEQVSVIHGENHDEIVLVKDIPFYSMCEHHLLPFLGHAHVAYIPHSNRVTGISKLARAVEVESKKLQMQERLTTDVAEAIMTALKPKGVMVVIEA